MMIPCEFLKLGYFSFVESNLKNKEWFHCLESLHTTLTLSFDMQPLEFQYEKSYIPLYVFEMPASSTPDFDTEVIYEIFKSDDMFILIDLFSGLQYAIDSRIVSCQMFSSCGL